MSNDWQASYAELKEYITANPEVNIGRDIVAIPKDYKPEFHRLFSGVRRSFIENNFSSLLSEFEALGRNYVDVKDEVVKLLGLAEVSLPSNLQRILNNPADELISVLFDPLFDLLKGKIDILTFEQTASDNIEGLCRRLYRQGYQEWVTQALITLLTPDRAFRVSIEDFDSEALATELTDGGDCEERLPNPQETKYLSFEHGRPPTFIVPDIIVYAAKTDQYFSLRTDLQEAVWLSVSVSDRREWLYLSSIRKEMDQGLTWPAIVIYRSDKLKELALIADYDRFCRPDLIIECMEQSDWYTQEGLDRVKLHHNVLKPTLGTYVISRKPVSKNAIKELELYSKPEQEQEYLPVNERGERAVGIRILDIGFDRTLLSPIIDLLTTVKRDTRTEK